MGTWNNELKDKSIIDGINYWMSERNEEWNIGLIKEMKKNENEKGWMDNKDICIINRSTEERVLSRIWLVVTSDKILVIKALLLNWSYLI